MLLTQQEVRSLEYAFNYRCSLRQFVNIFPSVGEVVEEAPAMVRCFGIYGHHFDVKLDELPKIIVDKVYRHNEM
jgi:hypothetical protein